MSNLDAPGVPDGPEGRLLVVPSDPADLEVLVRAKCPGSSHGDTKVHQN